MENDQEVGRPVGPHITIRASCYGCPCERSESYRVQGDSGHDIYCDHPEVAGKRVGDSRWDTPDWCPAGARLATIRTHLLANTGDA